LRIGAILPHVLVFGGVRRYIELGNAFVARGHRFTLYTLDGAMPTWLCFNGDVRPFGAIRDVRHDVLMCGSPELLEHLDRGRTRTRIFYLQLEGIAGEERVVRAGKYEIMVNSSGLARRVRRRYRIEPLDGIGGVNPDLFRPIASRPDGGPLRILCYGRTSKPRKGTRFVVQAARVLQRGGVRVELHLFDTRNPGSPDPRLGFDPGVPYRFYLDLPQERMAALYGAADVFVSAEHRAGWSNTAAEAACCGLPIVCTKSGTEDFAVHGESALVVPLRSPVAIAAALRRIARDRRLASGLGQEARARVLEFTWDALCARMERTFAELLSRGEGSRE
jgi:glycosyltransferase involved in cell wall biosynthesis